MGLLFAFMPVLSTAAGGTGDFDFPLMLTVMGRVALKLAVLALGALLVARTVLPPAWRVLARRFGAESFQLASIAFCLLCALATARQGISAELGAFVAGVMLSATEQAEAVAHHLGECLPALGLASGGRGTPLWMPALAPPSPCLAGGAALPPLTPSCRARPSQLAPWCPHPCSEPISQFFLSLFVSSTGLVLSPVFLMSHLPVLAMGAVAVILTKSILVRYSERPLRRGGGRACPGPRDSPAPLQPRRCTCRQRRHARGSPNLEPARAAACCISTHRAPAACADRVGGLCLWLRPGHQHGGWAEPVAGAGGVQG